MRVNDVQNSEQPPTQIHLCCLLARVLEIVVVTGYRSSVSHRVPCPGMTPHHHTTPQIYYSSPNSLVANPTCCLSGRSSSPKLSEGCTLLSEDCCCSTLQALCNCSLPESRSHSWPPSFTHRLRVFGTRWKAWSLLFHQAYLLKIPHVPPAFKSVAIR